MHTTFQILIFFHITQSQFTHHVVPLNISTCNTDIFHMPKWIVSITINPAFIRDHRIKETVS